MRIQLVMRELWPFMKGGGGVGGVQQVTEDVRE